MMNPVSPTLLVRIQPSTSVSAVASPLGGMHPQIVSPPPTMMTCPLM